MSVLTAWSLTGEVENIDCLVKVAPCGMYWIEVVFEAETNE